ncbi:MAG: nuclear transport factor 2 family protein [Chitinophagaceae bacterium]
MQPIEVVNKYLDIVFSRNGDGLSDILAKDFVFDDPFTVARSAEEFIAKSKSWAQAPKYLRMEKQFADGNHVCSIYTIEAMALSGSAERFQLADYMEVLRQRISKERVYFFDQVAFTKAMGFKDEYLKKYS